MNADLEQALTEALALLEREREAIVALDATAIQRAAEQKRELADKLLMFKVPDNSRNRNLHDRGRKLHEMALANAALLDDAQSTMAEALGLSEAAITYDRHARTKAGASTPLVHVAVGGSAARARLAKGA